MIQPAVFVKVLRTEAPRGDRATRYSPAWILTVTNGEDSFHPVTSFSCFETEYSFNEQTTLATARSVSALLGDVPISLYQRVGGLETFLEDLT